MEINLSSSTLDAAFAVENPKLVNFETVSGLTLRAMSFEKKRAVVPNLGDMLATFQRRLNFLNENQNSLQNPQTRRTFKRYLNDIESYRDAIIKELPKSTDPAISQYRDQFAALNDEYQQARPEWQRRLDASEQRADDRPGPATPLHKSLLDEGRIQEQDLTDEVEFAEREVASVVEQQRVIHQLMGQVHDIVEQGHQQVIAVEEATSEAKDEMGKGNEMLGDGEKDQKTSTKCIIWVLVIVIGGAVAVGLIVGLSIGLKK
jgi:chromosome segregation ATPase